MRKQGLIAGLFVFSLTLSAQMRELSFYEVKPAEAPPVLDGRLDDPVWHKVPVHRDYYEYWKSDPGPGRLRTEYRMAYDSRGVYLGIVNYEDRMDKIKKAVTDYDNRELWTDDCAELYFDPEANGIGYTKFTVNALGTRGDMRRQDAAVTLEDWNGTGWLVKTSLEKDRWTIEAFFPWEDLGKTAKTGDLWQFCHTRYGWSNGFIGVTSSPGGNYNATNNFGYLYFSDGKTRLDPAAVGKLLTDRVSPPWCLESGAELVSRTGSKVKIDELSELLAEARKNGTLLQLEIKALDLPRFDGEFRKILKRMEEVPKENTLRALKKQQDVNTALFNLKWQMNLDKNFNMTQEGPK
ncbi:MAG: hypothetical protein BWY31_00183 [Lentisphaerae bacterium ADurb.Bin242]|nr:MAG: hypothetical protein BWY31_00183 [Lentisphaerae bacterium ADurb.Bin242]